jgi:hypothetical protein
MTIVDHHASSACLDHDAESERAPTISFWNRLAAKSEEYNFYKQQTQKVLGAQFNDSASIGAQSQLRVMNDYICFMQSQPGLMNVSSSTVPVYCQMIDHTLGILQGLIEQLRKRELAKSVQAAEAASPVSPSFKTQ